MKEYIRNLALGLWIGLRARAQQALNDANVAWCRSRNASASAGTTR